MILWGTALVSPRNFQKIINDITIATTTISTLNETSGIVQKTGGQSFTWASLFEYTQNRSTSDMTYDVLEDPADEAWFITCA